MIKQGKNGVRENERENEERRNRKGNGEAKGRKHREHRQKKTKHNKLTFEFFLHGSHLGKPKLIKEFNKGKQKSLLCSIRGYLSWEKN